MDDPDDPGTYSPQNSSSSSRSPSASQAASAQTNDPGYTASTAGAYWRASSSVPSSTSPASVPLAPASLVVDVADAQARDRALAKQISAASAILDLFAKLGGSGNPSNAVLELFRTDPADDSNTKSSNALLYLIDHSHGTADTGSDSSDAQKSAA